VKVFSLTTGADTAGIGFGLSRVFRSEIRVRSMVATVNYIHYPVDFPYNRRRLERLYDAADVILLHNTTHGHDWYDLTGKPTVLMHHGRTPIEKFLSVVEDANRIGAIQIGSTIDLSVYGPVEWAPPPVDIRAMRVFRKPGPRLRIGHAPTNRDIKGTDAFVQAMDRLSRRYDVEPVLIERAAWTDCLKRKGTCDVVYDQSELGYGSNAIEAWAMGIPVLAGVVDPLVGSKMLETWGRLPFLETSEETLEADLERMIVDSELRHQYAERGTDHVERWHSYAAVEARLMPIFRAASPTVPGAGAKRRFRVGGSSNPAHALVRG
jgi:hypothetical protein